MIDACDGEIGNWENEENHWKASKIYAYQEDDLFISPLMYAAITRNKHAALLLMPHFLRSVHHRQHISALMMALRVGNFDVADMLLEEKDLFTAKRVTPYVGAIAGGSFAFAEEHFAEQRDIADESEKTPLH